MNWRRLGHRTPMGVGTAALVALATSACSSFSTVRSAEVMPGPSATLQASATTRTGDLTGWFWGGFEDCVTGCERAIVGGDVGLAYGWPKGAGAG